MRVAGWGFSVGEPPGEQLLALLSSLAVVLLDRPQPGGQLVVAVALGVGDVLIELSDVLQRLLQHGDQVVGLVLGGTLRIGHRLLS